MRNMSFPKIFPLFLFFFSMGLSLVLAAPGDVPEKAKLKVYYGESIGAGEAVYHIEACSRILAYAPLRCSKFNADDFEKQCKEDGKVREGKLIKGCLTGNKDKAGYEIADPAKLESECKDALEKQGFYYVPEWAVVLIDDKNGQPIENQSDWIVVGSLAWNTEDPLEIPQKVLDEVHDDSGALKRYKSGLCGTWDILVDGNKKDTDVPEAVKKALEEFYEKAPTSEAIANDLISNGCNNDNSRESLPFSTSDEPPPPSVRCSLLNRISSDSGVGLFAQYVGALYRWAAGVVGIVAVLVMVFSGVQISMAGGDSAKLDSAKNRIMQSIIGLAILFLSGLILYTINPGFFV